MENATVVTLSPSSSPITFEEVHSELRGRGRARRKKRKLARQDKKLTRIKARGERKAARQTNRSAQQAARQDRKDVRKTRRAARKEIGADEPEEETEEDTTTTQEGPADESAPDDYTADETSEDPEEGDEDTGEEEGDGDGEYFEGAEGPKAVDPTIAKLTSLITWNKEAIRRHKLEKERLKKAFNSLLKNSPSRNALGLSRYKSSIDDQEFEIQKHESRIIDLENELAKYGSNPQITLGYKLAETTLQKAKEKKTGATDKARVVETLIQKGIPAEVSPNRIEIPATNRLRDIEITSSATGNEVVDSVVHSITVPQVVIVLGLGAAIWYMMKSK